MYKQYLQSVGDSENSKQLPSSKMAGKYLQPLVYFQKGAEKNLAKFSQCIIDYFGKSGDLKTMVSVELVKNEFIVSDTKSASAQYIKIVHPSFCPIHNINPEQLSKVPEDILNRGINIGVSVLLESADGQILLSRRAAHLRTFPGIWVPPGGHVEENETLVEAGLREFEEEVGLHFEQQDFARPLQIIALWESTYPAKLVSGLPKRHHVVTYLYGKISSLTSAQLLQKIKMDANETDACVFLSKDLIKVVDLSREESDSLVPLPQDLPQTIKSVIFNDDKEQEIGDINLGPLFKRFEENKDNNGRISSGTKMALHEWLNLQS